MQRPGTLKQGINFSKKFFHTWLEKPISHSKKNVLILTCPSKLTFPNQNNLLQFQTKISCTCLKTKFFRIKKTFLFYTCFLVYSVLIIVKQFLCFIDIFFCTQPAFVLNFHGFYIVHIAYILYAHIVAFFLFLHWKYFDIFREPFL